VVGLLLALVCAGCGGSSKDDGGALTGDTLPDDLATGSVTLVADPVLSGAFDDTKARLAVDNAGLAVSFTYNADLTAGLEGGADMVAASMDTLGELASAGLVGEATPFARDELEAVISPGNPQSLGTATDLARAGLRVLVTPATSYSGTAARRVVAGLGVRQVTEVANAADAIAQVNAGSADAAIVYATEAAANLGDLSVSLPENNNGSLLYGVAVARASKNGTPAKSLIELLTYGTGSQAVQGRGFRLP
jgi:molybdate transport system substrate-binding protein